MRSIPFRRVVEMLQMVSARLSTPTSNPAIITLNTTESHYGVRPVFFALSAVIQMSILLVAILLTAIIASQPKVRPTDTNTAITISPFVLKPSSRKTGGGGGGGAGEKLLASKGTLPKPSRVHLIPAQIHPPLASKLQVQPTIVAPPTINLTGDIGDPLSKLIIPSGGPGVGGGTGNSSGGGIGSGTGPGIGPGTGGGIGGGIYRIGGGVSAPKPIFTPDPEYSDEARRAKFQGTVVLWAVVGADGVPRDIKVAQALGMGLDQKAMEAVHKWKFEPALKEGHPVAVQMNIVVDFHLY